MRFDSYSALLALFAPLTVANAHSQSAGSQSAGSQEAHSQDTRDKNDKKAKVEAWPELARGEYPFQGTTKIHVEYPFGDKIARRTTEFSWVEERVVIGGEEDGSLEILVRCRRVWGSIRGPDMKKPVLFDSANDERVHPLARNVVAVFAGKRQYSVDAAREHLNAQRVLDSGRRVRAPEQIQLLRAELPLAPPRMPLRVGDTWKLREKSAGAVGSPDVEMLTTHRVTAIDEGESVQIRAEAMPAQSSRPNSVTGSLRRELRVSLRDGFALALEIRGDFRSDKKIRTVAEVELRRTKALSFADKFARTKEDLRAIASAAMRYKLARRRFPETVRDLTPAGAELQFLAREAVDVWNWKHYVLEAADGRVAVRCLGADGEAGTADDLSSENIDSFDAESYLRLTRRER